MVLPSGRIYSVTPFPEYVMKQIDHLIEALRNHVVYKARMGLSSRTVVFTASQNLIPVLNAAGEIAHSILKGIEWDHSTIGESEIALRRDILLKDLFYSKRIVIDVYEKPFPHTEGNYLEIHTGEYDRVFYDMDTCHKVLMHLGRDPE